MTKICEMEFRAKYPHANVRDTKRTIAGYKIVAVYAGDYLCAEGLTVAEAFRRALDYEDAGLIQPDPNEERTA